MTKAFSLIVWLILCPGCFTGTQIRYVVDVKTPIDRKQASEHVRQDKGHPTVGKVRPEVRLRTVE